MEILNDLCVLENSCIGLGFFDGVHLGHRRLLEKLTTLSKENNTKSVVLTFQKSPAESFLGKVDYITSSEERESYISALGVDFMIKLDFTNIMTMSAEEYLKNVICAYFKPKYILTGFNHTFGKNKGGYPEFLKTRENIYGYKYIELPPVKEGEEIISSTAIRKYLVHGDIKRANKMLGYNYTIKGIVQKGNQIGRTIGFPTANIDYPDFKPQIPFGVYCARVNINGTQYKGILNYGIKPTINSGENKPVAEIHIIGFNNDIYGEEISISVLDKIRDEKRFNSLEELKKQIKEDIKKC